MPKYFYIILSALVLTVLGFLVLPTYAGQKLPAQYKTASACDTVLLEFYWETCSACRKIAPFVNQAESALKAKGLHVQRINIEQESNQKLIESFNVHAVPAFFLFGGNQKMIQPIPIGSVSGANLQRILEKAVSKYRTATKCH